ncbi:DUF2069 domain-containing protein [Moritella marina ATCC 15381]|uniref:DUF2069 domain-containing protein n=1 Tax=Moritella marina ATCC 15381 TaxID=1202962 RepID=A0A5J6WLB0_MORMI|nr:DUF2069 domain-containing protein [Moritella marina]QFI38899.1 DUF2069 domain-containing protein [Moritella marina ATCC 15381]
MQTISTTQDTQKRITQYRLLGLFGYFGLIILMIVWQLWLTPEKLQDHTQSQALAELTAMADVNPELLPQVEAEKQKWLERQAAHESNPLAKAFIWILPLLIPFYGLVKGKPYTAAWSNFVVMIYYMHSLTIMYTDPDERYLAILEFVLANCMLFGNGIYARMQGKELGLGLDKLKVVMAEEKEREEAYKAQHRD